VDRRDKDRRLEVCLDIVGYVGPHEKVFLEGACCALAIYLKRRYPDAVIWYVPCEHLFTVIDGVCYDARGIIPKPEHARKAIWSRAFSQMRRNATKELIKIGHWDRV
jgi:hypothetical protein